MPRRASVTFVSLIAAAALAATATAKPIGTPLATRLARALAVPHVPASRSAAIAVDLRDGRTIFARHQALALVPASNQKLAISFAALSVLGPEHRFGEVLTEEPAQPAQ